jgi:hypothetical protein
MIVCSDYEDASTAASSRKYTISKIERRFTGVPSARRPEMLLTVRSIC